MWRSRSPDYKKLESETIHFPAYRFLGIQEARAVYDLVKPTQGLLNRVYYRCEEPAAIAFRKFSGLGSSVLKARKSHLTFSSGSAHLILTFKILL